MKTAWRTLTRMAETAIGKHASRAEKVAEVEALTGVKHEDLDGDRLRAFVYLVEMGGAHLSLDERHLGCGCVTCDARRVVMQTEGGCDVCTTHHGDAGGMPHDSRRWLGDRLETREEALSRGVKPERLLPISTKREALRELRRIWELTPAQVDELAALSPEEIGASLAELGLRA